MSWFNKKKMDNEQDFNDEETIDGEVEEVSVKDKRRFNKEGERVKANVKDKETVERFVEEILVTSDKKDLVPILHRFGAYLETLFGQVNMRTVLAKQPFGEK